jgi:flavin reductase (DIM6/NTAB) family NADH-FMN oxidoreductase RutF
MNKIPISTNVFINPMPVVLVGAMSKSKPNFMTVGWITRVNSTPPMLAVSISKSHYTADLIRENRAFSINIPGPDVMERVDYCGLVSGKDKDKTGVFDVFFGTLKTAPMIKQCPICLECKLFDTMTLQTNYLFIGEIVGAFSEEKYLTDKLLDVQKIKPLSFTMPDCAYRATGESIGKAWSEGKKLMK